MNASSSVQRQYRTAWATKAAAITATSAQPTQAGATRARGTSPGSGAASIVIGLGEAEIGWSPGVGSAVVWCGPEHSRIGPPRREGPNPGRRPVAGPDRKKEAGGARAP